MQPEYIFNLRQRIKLELIITQREAMIAENKYRQYLDESITYGETEFISLLKKLEQLLQDYKANTESK